MFPADCLPDRSSPRRVWRLAMPAALAPLLLVGLGGCGSTPPPDSGARPQATPAPPAGASAPPVGSAPPASPAVGSVAAGFTPLPTPQQVQAAVPQGRLDPFAPLAVSLAAGAPPRPLARAATPLALPEGFRFTGVMSSGGRPLAIVQNGTESGPVTVGDRGGRSTDLLPAGWSVAAIDVGRGRLTLIRRLPGEQARPISLEL